MPDPKRKLIKETQMNSYETEYLRKLNKIMDENDKEEARKSAKAKKESLETNKSLRSFKWVTRRV